MAGLDKNNGNWSITDNLPSTLIFSNKTENLNSNVFNKASGID